MQVPVIFAFKSFLCRQQFTNSVKGSSAYKEFLASGKAGKDDSPLIDGAGLNVSAEFEKSLSAYPASAFTEERDGTIIREVLSSPSDSLLLEKFNNQAAALSLLRPDSTLKNDSIYKLLNEGFSGLTIKDLSGKASENLLTKKTQNVSAIIFWLVMISLAFMALFRNWSLIPLLGVATCLYLLTGMTLNNWLWFAGWMALGLVIYLLYGYKKSKLAKQG